MIKLDIKIKTTLELEEYRTLDYIINTRISKLERALKTSVNPEYITHQQTHHRLDLTNNLKVKLLGTKIGKNNPTN